MFLKYINIMEDNVNVLEKSLYRNKFIKSQITLNLYNKILLSLESEEYDKKKYLECMLDSLNNCEINLKKQNSIDIQSNHDYLEKNQFHNQNNNYTTEFYVSDCPNKFQKQAARFLNDVILNVYNIEL